MIYIEMDHLTSEVLGHCDLTKKEFEQHVRTFIEGMRNSGYVRSRYYGLVKYHDCFVGMLVCGLNF